jgi:hypothetical protein
MTPLGGGVLGGRGALSLPSLFVLEGEVGSGLLGRDPRGDDVICPSPPNCSSLLQPNASSEKKHQHRGLTLTTMPTR